MKNVFPKGILKKGYYVSVACELPKLELTAYNVCGMNEHGQPHLVIQVVAETLSMMSPSKR